MKTDLFQFLDTYNSNVRAHYIVPEVSEVVLISFNSCFSFFLSASFISTILSSNSLIFPFASVIILLFPSRVLLISAIVLFFIDLLFFLILLGPC